MLKLLLGLAALGWGYHSVRIVVDAKRFPPPGALVSVGAHRLHIVCEGRGEPTVILDAGAGAWSVGLRRLQTALRDSLRVCAYDRAGLGWSDPSAAYDARSASEELGELVKRSGISKPFVLVGHSFGANIAQVYAAAHRPDLAGLLLIDPGTPDDMLEDFHHPDSVARAMSGCGWKCGVGYGAAGLGLTRIAAHWAGTKWMTDEENAIYKAGIARPKTARALIGSLVLVPKSAVETRDAVNFGDLPVTVVFSENTRKPTGKETAADVAAWHDLKLRQMSELLQGTTCGRGPITVPGATHMSMTFAPEAVALIASEVLRVASARPRVTACRIEGPPARRR